MRGKWTKTRGPPKDRTRMSIITAARRAFFLRLRMTAIVYCVLVFWNGKAADAGARGKVKGGKAERRKGKEDYLEEDGEQVIAVVFEKLSLWTGRRKSKRKRRRRGVRGDIKKRQKVDST